MFDSVDTLYRDEFEKSIGWVFRLKAAELLNELYAQLLLLYAEEDIAVDNEFIYARGTLPVLLVAHVDTVHKTPVNRLCYDPCTQMLWSPEGIGGDDRAGVLGILKLLERGHRPHVLFTDGEESGGIGAKAAVKNLPVPDIRFAIQLDRRNGTEAVFYQCWNKAFEDYILKFGFKKATGSFSDISVLCPAWKVAGVNLSCGYYNAHTTNEYVCLEELVEVLYTIERIFEELPAESFVYSTYVAPVSKIVPLNTGYKGGVTTYNRGRPSYLDDTDWENDVSYGMYGSCGGYGGANYNYKEKYTIPGSYDVELSPFDLMTLYGKTYMFWRNFLSVNHQFLKDYATESLYLAVDELLADAVEDAVADAEEWLNDISEAELDECTEEDKQLLSKKK